MFLNNSVKSQTIFFAAFCLLLTVLQIRAAVTEDSRSAGGAADNVGLPSLTCSHTIGSGTNRALFVGVSTATTTTPASLPVNRVQSVTYGGVALTRVGTIVSANTLNSSEIFRLVNPPVGTANIVVTFSTTLVAGVPVPFVNQASGNAVSFFGVLQTTPTGAFSSATGTDRFPTVAVTDSLAGDIVFDELAASPSAVFFGAGAGQIVCSDINDETTCTRGRRFFNGSYDVGAASTKAGASPIVTMNWTMTNADNWALGAVTVRQSAITAASVSVGGRVMVAGGKPVARARVTLTNANGETRTTLTNFFGFYRFNTLAAGETYVLNVFSKQYSFNPQVVTINEDMGELNFVAQP